MKPKRILMVDDDPDYAAGTRLILARLGFEFIHAPNPEQGLSLLDTVAPDLIILDVVMNNKTEGFLFAKKLRSSPAYARFARTPILVLTGMRGQQGYAFSVKQTDAMFLPCDEFLEKPVKPEALLKTVEELLRMQSEP